MALQTKTFSWGDYAWKSYSNAYVIDLILTEQSVSQDGNSSEIYYEMVLRSGIQNRFTGDVDSVLRFNGKEIASGTKHITAAYSASWTLLSGTATVDHNSDGSLTMPIEMSIKTYNSYAPPSTTQSWNWELTEIPRESSFGSVTGAVLGSTMRVNITRNSDRFTHRVYYYSEGQWCGGYEGETYVDMPLGMDLASTTKLATVDLPLLLRTYNGEEQIGEDVRKTVTVSVPDNEETKPTVEMQLFPAVTPLDGLYLQGLSKVKATIQAEGQYGADIASYELKVGESRYGEPYVSGYLTDKGVLEVIGTAKDSRGFVGEVRQSITVLPYSKPVLSNVRAYRCTSAGVPAEDGEYLKIEATRKYAPVVAEGIQRNFCRIQYQYKAENAQQYSEPETILAEEVAGDTVITGALLNAAFYKSSAYMVQVTATDTVGQKATVIIPIPSERVFRHKRAGGRGLGLGGYCEEDNLLDVHWNARVRGDMKVDEKLQIGGKNWLDHVYPVGSVYVTTVDESPAKLFGGTWEVVEAETPVFMVYAFKRTA